jgi:Na+/H+ antiporter
VETSELILGLLVTVAALSVVARFVGVPYPITLVIGGVGIALIPGLPEVELEPDLVLAIFLPPLLYSAAFFSSLRDLRADLRPISLAAIALVLATMCGVAVVAHALIDGMPWAVAFALGAIVAPTDPIAATAIARRMGLPRRIVTFLEGESLVNDASALIAYRVAVAAAIGGSFSLVDAAVEFVWAVIGGIAIGLVIGRLIAEIRRKLDDVPVEITISLFTGYAAFLPAEAAGVSGVLAVVTAGLVLGWMAPEISSSSMRTQGIPVWENLVFLLNATLFVLIGLQLRTVVDGLDGTSAATLAWWAIAVCATVVGVRFLFGNTVPYLVRALDRRESQRARRVDWRSRQVIAWGGMRGGVSLAAALALPFETDAGTPFPFRDELIFLTFCVILFTLVVEGLTMPAVVRASGLRDEGEEEREELAARLAAAEAALFRLDELAEEEWTRDETVERVRGLYLYRQRRFTARDGGGEDGDAIEERSLAYQRLVRELLNAQHRALIDLRNQGVISSDVMRRIEREIDLEDERLEI